MGNLLSSWKTKTFGEAAHAKEQTFRKVCFE